jgi:hypothetical protein
MEKYDENSTLENKTKSIQDSIVKSVVEKFISRSEFGMKKYGTNLDRTDLKVLDWIQHAQEEHMDAILYLEKLKKEITEQNKKN